MFISPENKKPFGIVVSKGFFKIDAMTKETYIQLCRLEKRFSSAEDPFPMNLLLHHQRDINSVVFSFVPTLSVVRLFCRDRSVCCYSGLCSNFAAAVFAAQEDYDLPAGNRAHQ